MYGKFVPWLVAGLVLAFVGGAGAQELGQGHVLFEFWYGGGIGGDLDTLKAHPDFPDNPRDSKWETSFATDQPNTDYYGGRGRAFLTPPETGDYTFWVFSDDDSELWLSSDDSAANAVQIAGVEGWTGWEEWGKYETQQSAPVTLEAGQRYYIEGLYSDGTGGGNMGVGWAGPGIGEATTLITGDYLTALIRDPEPLFQAQNPDPADGSVDVTMPLFQWQGGLTAAMHDVYFGETAELGEADFKGRQPALMYFCLDPLEPGKTYYWRVDEIDANDNVYEGDVWNFTVMPLEAHWPSPYDGALWRKLDQTFNWTAGQGAASHLIYGGTDEALVAAGDPNALLGQKEETTFSITEVGLESLEPDTRYFWRIDEVDAAGTVAPGPVWTFTTVDVNGGALAYYWDNQYFEGDPCIVTVVPEINFDWGSDSSPDPCIPIDHFTCLWVAELNVPVTGTYRLFEASDDGSRTKLNGAVVAEGWADRGTTEDATEPLELVAGETYLIEMQMYENGGGATAYLYWEGPGIAKEIIPQGALQLPQVAYGMSPALGAEGVSDATSLSWTAGVTAVEHDVYFGTDADLVAAGDASVLMGRVAETSYTPADLLVWNTTYYWKVDEVTEDGTVIPGTLYGFTTEDHRILEDFEAYDDVPNLVPIEPVAAPIAQYVFDGDVNDVSGNGPDGTIMGDITFEDDPIMGSVLSLPGGDNQFVEIGAVGIDGNSPSTIACWAKADNTSIPDWTLIFGFTGTADGSGGNGSHFNIGSLGGPGGVGAHVWGWEETIFSDTEALEWHHYAMTYDGTTIRYYGDGTLMDTDTGKSNVMDLAIRGDRVHIGSRVTQASSFPGKVDDCRVYDYTLTDAEVAGLYVPMPGLGDTWSDDGAVTSWLATDPDQGQALKIAYDSGTGSVRAAVGSLDLTWGPNAIAMMVKGDPNNAAAALFLAAEDGAGHVAIVPVIGSSAAVQTAEWTKVIVALDDVVTGGVNIADIAKVAVGIDASGAGAVLIDDIQTVRIWEYVPRNWAITLDIPGSLSLSGPDQVFTTDHIIRQGEVFTLSISVRVGFGAIWDNKNITMSILADGAVVSNKTGPCADGWKQYSITFKSANAPAKDGTLVGVRFRNEIHNTLALKNIKLTAK